MAENSARIRIRELSVRSKADRRLFSASFVIMFYTGRTVFFICSENHTDSSVDRKSEITDRFQCINRSDYRSLVIQNSAAVHLSVMNLACQRRVFPSLSKRNNIQMSKNRCHFFALAIFDPANLVVKIACLKSKLLAQCQSVVQSFLRSSSIWCVFLRCAFDTFDCDTLFDGSKDLIFKLHHLLV